MTIKKSFCISTLFFSLICVTNIKAQTNVGLDFGATYNKLNFIPSNNTLIITSKQGYIINFNIERELNNYFSLEATPGTLQKNYSIKNKKNIYQDTENTYLQLPISIKMGVTIIGRLKIGGSIGGYYAYWIRSTTYGLAPNAFELSSNITGDEYIKIEDIKAGSDFTKKNNRSELGLAAKIEMNYKILNDISCSVKGHYYRSLMDQQKRIMEQQIPRYNETLAVTIGISYLFN